MATRKTYKFLPTVFQSDANKKFLAATMDQLVTEPNLTTLYGYIGRKFAPTYKTGDSYIIENNATRQDYQLEPAVVIRNEQNDITFVADYVDLLDKIGYYGGLTDNHSRLFQQEYYTFDPKISFDKLVNFSQYYWLPNGPDPVNVSTSGIDLTTTYTVTRDAANGRYVFRNNGVVDNSIILARGGRYEFVVDQPGVPFWIQTETGVDGVVSATPTLSSRDVFGVENNGTDVGTVTFRVPQTTGQDRYVNMPTVYSVDYATPIPYYNLSNKFLSQFLTAFPQYASITGQLNGKYTIFVDVNTWTNVGDNAWTDQPVYDTDGDLIPGYGAGTVVPEADRYGVWRVVFVDIGQKLKLDTPIAANLAAGTSLTVGSQVTALSYNAVAGQQYVYVPSSVTATANATVKRTDVITALSATASGTNYITVTSTTGLVANMTVVFTGNPTVGGIATSTTYYIKSVVDQTTFTISATLGGSEVALTNDTGIMDVTASYTDIPAGTKITSITKGDPLLKLVHIQNINVDEKVYVKIGLVNANREFYKDYDGFLYVTPQITAQNDILWIQDGVATNIYAPIKLIKYAGWTIDVTTDIIGQLNYTSPNGVEFTSGLKVEFGDDVTPTYYQNNQFYVEQVGDTGHGIQLIPVDELVTPEAYNDEIAINYPGEYLPDYITINRASKDRNAWSRNNRWFHVDVITATAAYNNTVPTFSNGIRGQRPIVQFEVNLQLFNEGRVAKAPIDVLDTIVQNAFTELQGKTYTNVFGIDIIDSSGNPVYPNGLRVIFANDTDPLVKDKIYNLTLVQYSLNSLQLPSGPYYIELTKAADGDVTAYDTTVVTLGVHKGSQWWFDGINWNLSQQKTYLQQAPLFDVLDSTLDLSTGQLVKGKSLSQYTRSTFAGTKIFGYDRATSGIVDSVLSKGPVAPIKDANGNDIYNFYLSYKNFNTQGDIKFSNFYSTDTFSFVDSAGKIVSQHISLGYIQKIVDGQTLLPKNTWLTVPEQSRQYQLFSFIYTGPVSPDNLLNINGYTDTFTLDITPAAGEQSIPYVKVFQNFVYLKPTTDWTIKGNQITINTPLSENDQIDILIYSTDISSIAFYQVPQNLDLNAQNIDVDNLTLGQMRNHLVALAQNSTIVTGDVLAQSNLRDIDIKQQGGTILKHSAPTPYASLFLIDDQANFINSVRYTQQEYTKFKNKFLELSLSLPGIDATDPVSSVDTILAKINLVKNKSFPWYYSDMVPYGPLKNIVGQIGAIDGFEVFDPLKTNYEITEIFNDSKLSNKAVLVYLNNQQLVNGVDYTFRTDTPSIDFNVTLAVGDIIKIVEYSNTDGNYIPETPTKLGLWPSYIPEVFIDDTYRTPTTVIRGHDGSITPAFGDYRDEFLLELELRIYNNIKLPANTTFSDIFSVIPGKFRDSDYTLADLNRVISTSFLSWIGNNKLDYTSNETFDPNDPFTWNYSSSRDRIDGEYLPGSWRACYMYFYDTYRPHLTPWEMLGFTSMPSWWEAYYGPAPYTGGNTVLWNDLEAGYIRYGERQGVDLHYARPGLSNIIPVDENGNLISVAQLLSRTFNNKQAGSAWAVGQQGPVEFAWRMSSDFPYAAQVALALMKPAKYFGTLIDVNGYTPLNPLYTFTTDAQGITTEVTQYLEDSTNQPITQSTVDFNGDTTAGVIYRSAGYLNWITDYLINQGVNPKTYLLPLIQNFQVNLTYKVSGFTDQKYLEVLAEQVSPTSTNDSILVPNENYNVYLNEKPVPVDEIVYSALIIEKTPNGYSVRGYDLFNSYFTIIPSIVNNNFNKITVLNSTATVYKDYQDVLMNVPYGYEFNTQQQVVDFMISYERYLMSQGWTFTDMDSQLNSIKDWKLSSREFLYWAQQGWKPGSILVVSPVSNTLNAITNGSTTEGIEDSQYGSKVVDQNFNLIKNNNYAVYRTPTEFKLELQDSASVIGFVKVSLVQYEHTLVFDNTTVFNDVIYQPSSGNRQYRLKLIGQRTADWNGSLSPEGYIYNSGVVDVWNQGTDYLQGDLVQYKNQYYTALQDIPANTTFQFQYWQVIPASAIQKGLLPNFSTLAVESQSYYDSYAKIRDKNQMAYSHALIGFRERQYLSDLGLTETTQIEFYKGYVAQKGSKNAVDAFTKANINNLTSNISLYEEWAVRVGEYGALSSNPFVEIALDEKAFGVNPSVAQFVDAAENNLADGVTVFNSTQLYKSYGAYSANVALNRTENSDYNNDIPTAGYVNINDVDLQIFDLTNYVDLDNNIADMGSGYTIWVAKDFTQDWNVYRVTETNNQVTAVSNSLNGYITFSTENPHGFSKYSIFLVKNFDALYDGFYQVLQVTSASSVLVKYTGDITTLSNLTTQTGSGMLFRLDSMRFKYMEDSRIYGLSNPPNGWRVGDKIWIDDDAQTTAVQGQPFGTQPSGTWKVYEKQAPWNLDQEVKKGLGEYSNTDAFGTSVKMSSDGLIIVSGAPNTNSNVGQVSTFLRDFSGTFNEATTLNPLASNTKAFGFSVDLSTTAIGDSKVAVGAPNSWTGNGYVYIYDKLLSSYSVDIGQVILGNVAGDQFGYSVAFNQDGEWLYVGAPGNNSVYAYGLKRYVPTQRHIESINNKNTIKLSGNITANPGDVLIQANTGAKTTIKSIVSNTEIVVDSTTNFVFAQANTSGNVAVGNLTILANINVLSSGNLTAYSVYPLDVPGVSPSSTPVVNSITITSFTPDPTVGGDANSLLIASSDKTYIPNVDYTFDFANAKVNFTANIATSTVTITQRPYYALVQKLSMPTANSWAQFGYAVASSFDGAQVAVGAPGDSVTDINGVLQSGAGAVYVYDRVIEAFNSVTDSVAGSSGQDYQTVNAIASVHKVTIDGIENTEYIVIGNNIIRFINLPAIGQVIFVEVNKFNYLERLIGVDSLTGGLAAIQANAAFGTSLTICSNNCAIYIGAPYYDNGTQYNSGAVWKFHNRGRLYGTDTGYVKNPTFNPVDTIRLNNFEVRVSLGLSGNTTVSTGDWITQPSTGANVQVIRGGANIATVKVSGYQNANVFSYGANIAINNTWPLTNVSVRATTLDEFVQDVNNSNILGVTATNSNGYLRLDSDVKVAKDQLRILSGVTNTSSLGPLAESEMIVFAFMQIIINPFGLAGEYFGSKVKLASNAYMLVIGSSRGTTRELTVFDANTTTNGTYFDATSTRFHDSIQGSGSVYIYELYDDPRNAVAHPGRYAFAQQLDTGTLLPGTQFGYALDIEGTYITIAAPGATVTGAQPSSGSVYVFRNPTMARGWGLIRYQQPKVDLDSVTRAYMYDTQTNLIKDNLQFVDPAKGRILGQAEENISFKTEYDPAIYNQGYNPAADINSNVYWGANQVGRVWWDLSTVRFIDYEQDSITYRSLHWGELFKGSTINVYEWVESNVLPSQYNNNYRSSNGVPKHVDDSAYVEVIDVDQTTGIVTNKYYFWIYDETQLDEALESRTLPVRAIADYIENPKSQGVAYAAMIKSNAIAFYNVADYLSADNTIVHLDHQLAINTDLIHSEYELLQQGNPNNLIPNKLVNKLIDSLSGIDSQGATVPDPTLSLADRYGISIRPRQSMFVDRVSAVNEMVQYVNNIFAVSPIAEQFSLTGLNAQEAPPNFKRGEYNQAVATEVELAYIDTTPLSPGYLVLVENDTQQDGLWVLYTLSVAKTWDIVRVQSYKTGIYWSYTDWYAAGYSAATRPDFSVETTVDALKLQATIGSVIYINNATGNNTWQLVTADVDNTLSVVGIQNGTIQLDTTLGDYVDNGLGFGNQDFDSNRYDQNPSNEIRAIVDTLYNDIFKNTLQGEFNNLFFVLVNYLLTEQVYVDWLFKSSFISITHKLRTLSQFPSYQVDNQTYYQSYINEVKPYRTKIREYLIDYTGEDTFGGDITDFDLPAYYDTYGVTSMFRSPSGERPYVAEDEATWQTWPYNQWYNNRFLKVESIRIENAGKGYILPPTVTIVSVDGRGNGATATATIDGNIGSVTAITVTNKGQGYTSTPQVIINGSVVGNITVIGGNANITSLTYGVNSTNGLFTGMRANTAFSSDTVIVAIDKANSQITMSAANISTVTNTAISFGYAGVNSGTNATAYAVMKSPVVRSFDSKLKFDRINYTSNVKVWTANTTYTKTEFDANGRVTSGDIITYAQQDGNVMIRKAYFVKSNITTTSQFISNEYTVCPTSYFNNANDRIIGYYEPGNTMPAVDTIITAVTMANTATNTNTIYVYNAASLSKNMYIGESNVAAGYVTNITGNINLQVNSLGHFYGNLRKGSTAIENISNMANLQVGQYVTGANIGYESTIVSINYTTNSVNLTDTISGNVVLANISFGGIPIKATQVTLSTNVTLSTDTTIYARYDSLEQLVPGVTYPTSVTQSAPFTLNPLFGRSYDIAPYDPVQFSKDGIALLSTSVYDQALYSLYANIALGTAPADIVTQGGQFIDTYHSRAPEELIPGITFDTLDMRIYTKISANVDAYRIFNNMVDDIVYSRISTANTTQLSTNLSITDANIYVLDATLLTDPSVAIAQPGVVFINGERITYYTKTIYTPVVWSANTTYASGSAINYAGNNYVVTGNVNANAWTYVNSANIAYLPGTNVLGQLMRGTQGTGAAVSYAAGTRVTDASISQTVPAPTNKTNANVWIPLVDEVKTTTAGKPYTFKAGQSYKTANIWLNSSTGANVTDGTGLAGSTTTSALFIKSLPSYDPTNIYSYAVNTPVSNWSLSVNPSTARFASNVTISDVNGIVVTSSASESTLPAGRRTMKYTWEWTADGITWNVITDSWTYIDGIQFAQGTNNTLSLVNLDNPGHAWYPTGPIGYQVRCTIIFNSIYGLLPMVSTIGTITA